MTSTTAKSTWPEETHYDAIEQHLSHAIKEGRAFLFDTKLFEDELTHLWDKYEVPYQTLLSFIRNLHISHVKKTAPIVKKSLEKILQDYCGQPGQQQQQQQQQQSILDLSRKSNYPPYLFSRIIVEAVTTLTGNKKKKELTEAMRDPLGKLSSTEIYLDTYRATNVPTRLPQEVQEALDADPMYGPIHDRNRYMVGVEFEVVLEYKLKKMNVLFETEAQLRERGTSKTPDVLLKCPLGIEVPKKDGTGNKEWKMVCWIDSKALFGDVHTHQTSVLPQAESYVHRFGPGLVLYWFGHAPVDRLSDAQGDITILSWDVPDTFMLPTGEMLSSKNENDA